MLHKRVADRWLNRNASDWESKVQKLLRQGKYQDAAVAILKGKPLNTHYLDLRIVERLETVHKSERFLWVHDTELGLLDGGAKYSPFTQMVLEEYNNIRYAYLSDPYLKLRMCFTYTTPLLYTTPKGKYPYLGRGITAEDIETNTLRVHLYRQHEHYHDNPQTLVSHVQILDRFGKVFATADPREIKALGMTMREAVDALRYFNPMKEDSKWHRQTGRDV